jgi:hypothetical protein
MVEQVINQFDKDFQEQSDEIIFQTILAANFLDIKNLLELMCKKVADEIKKCKTPDDIRDRYHPALYRVSTKCPLQPSLPTELSLTTKPCGEEPLFCCPQKYCMMDVQHPKHAPKTRALHIV